MNNLNLIEGLEQAPAKLLNTRHQARRKAYLDFIQGLMMWRVWMALAWQDIKIRYRRSVIGPFWITLSMAITVYSMGFLYSRLFHMSLEDYFPYLVAGMLAWTLVQTTLHEGVDVYLVASSLVRQVKLPYIFHIHRMCFRNCIISAHNLLVMIPIYLFFHQSLSFVLCLPVLLLNILILYMNLIFVTNVLGMVCARYRDMGQVFKSLLQVLFFLTPVMWNPASLGPKYQFLVFLNPLYDFIQLIRMPLIGQLPTLTVYGMVLVFSLLGLSLNYFLFVRYRSRIVYWL
jgi:ABC-type polysaccharide/polyol phosphate export permease